MDRDAAEQPSVKPTVLHPDLHRSRVSRYRAACAQTLAGRILDCGGGLGEYLPHFRGEAVVFDRAVPALATLADCHRVAGDAEHLPFRDDSFDNAWSCAVAQYLHLPVFLREIVRVTRPGGRVLVLVPNGRSPWDRVKRALGMASWWEQQGIVTQYSVDDLAPYGQVTGEVRFLPFESLLRGFPRLGHTLMLELTVLK